MSASNGTASNGSVPPAEGDTRRYRVRHETTYEYSAPVSSSFGRAYLTPRTTGVQRCSETSVTVEPAPVDQSRGRDVYGNENTYFQVSTEHTRLVVTGVSMVEVDPPLRDTQTLSRPWESFRPAAPERADDGDPERPLAVEFVIDGPRPEIDEQVHAYALESFTPGRPIGDATVDLTRRIFRDFTYLSGSTTVTTRVSEVFAERRGVCQDFARLGIACLRSLGLAARYVSGYLATQPPPGKERMIGADATHAWAAVWIGGDNWLEFDPTNDQLADERYVTVAWGRDYVDVPPLRGIIQTEAKDSSIRVSVDVAPV